LNIFDAGEVSNYSIQPKWRRVSPTRATLGRPSLPLDVSFTAGVDDWRYGVSLSSLDDLNRMERPQSHVGLLPPLPRRRELAKTPTGIGGRALTGSLGDADRSLTHGFDYHLIKPVDPNQIERLLSHGAESLSAGPDAFQGISP
jgi:hypothetical protein